MVPRHEIAAQASEGWEGVWRAVLHDYRNEAIVEGASIPKLPRRHHLGEILCGGL